jgi:hypothetical protein
MTADEWKEFGALWDSLLTDPKTTDVEIRWDRGDDDNEARTGDYEVTIDGVVCWADTPLQALRKSAENHAKMNRRAV